MTKDELKSRLLEIVDNIAEDRLKEIDWQDKWKDFIIHSIECGMANILSYDQLLIVYEYSIYSILSRYSRGYFSLLEAKSRLKELHSFYRYMKNYVEAADIYSLSTSDGKQYINYRGLSCEVYADDYGQQMVLKFRDKEFPAGAYNFLWEYDMCDFIDTELLNDNLQELDKINVGTKDPTE